MSTAELGQTLAFIQEAATLEPNLSKDVIDGLNRVFHLLARVANGKDTRANISRELSTEVTSLRKVLPAAKAQTGGWAATILATAEDILPKPRAR